MYVIQGTPEATIGAITTADVSLFPADRCVWSTEPDTNGGYTVAAAEFCPPGGTSYTGIDSPVLGYVGKSGRFVAITN